MQPMWRQVLILSICASVVSVDPLGHAFPQTPRAPQPPRSPRPPRVPRTPQPPQRAADKPNVVLIIMDDLGYGDIGSYGVRDAKTPNLDRLAREGVRLTDAYSNGANCSPTRSALISGRYQQRVGIERPLDATIDLDRGLPVT